jgi:hypothetical protein
MTFAVASAISPAIWLHDSLPWRQFLRGFARASRQAQAVQQAPAEGYPDP